MFNSEELPRLREVVRGRALADKKLLEDLCAEVRSLVPAVRTIKPRATTAISLVASDGGNNRLVFDPFYIQLIRVVDSYGKQLCLDAVSPTTDLDELAAAQFNSDGTARTALGRMMLDLGVKPPTLHNLSPMIPDAKVARENPSAVAPSWVLVYRDLCEWAVLYEQICHRRFATDTLIVRDGLLRSKIFRGDYFIRLRDWVKDAIARILREDHRRVYLVGIAKRSKVLERYNLAMAIEHVLPGGEARYVPIPREMEARAYVWPEYARGEETEGGGEAPKFVAGSMFFVRFGRRSGDPVWTIDLLSSQVDQAAEIFGYLLADAIEGFPVPFYPRSLQKAHECAQIVDLDVDIFQDEILAAIRQLLPSDRRQVLDEMRLQTDVSERRYG